jgi:hypothetical protein
MPARKGRDAPDPGIERLRRIEHVRGFALRATFDDGRVAEIDLSGVIDRRRVFRPFAEDPDAFARVKVIDRGAGIEWDNGLDFSAGALVRMADAQERMSGADFAAWIEKHGLSVNETADIFGLGRHAIMNYRRANAVPLPIQLACAAMDAEPLIFLARLTPRRAGRPRKDCAA